jgi:hypothetical protein
MSKSYKFDLTKHQASSLIFSIFQDAQKAEAKWTGCVGKKLCKEQDPYFEVLANRVTGVSTCGQLMSNLWETDGMSKFLDRQVKIDYYYGSPGFISITTVDNTREEMSKGITELSNFYRNTILNRETEPLGPGLQHLTEFLTLPPSYEWKGRTVFEYGTAGVPGPKPAARILQDTEKDLMVGLLSTAYERLEGYPVRHEMILKMTELFALEDNLPVGCKEILKAEKKYCKANPDATNVKAEARQEGGFYDVVTGETIIID